jgi:hypothetical protein
MPQYRSLHVQHVTCLFVHTGMASPGTMRLRQRTTPGAWAIAPLANTQPALVHTVPGPGDVVVGGLQISAAER